MDITFDDNKLQDLCEKTALAQRKLGEGCAKKLRTRLSDLESASNVGELVAGHPHPLKGNRLGQFALDLEGGVRLVLEPNHDPIPRKEDESTDWPQVSKVRIVFIGDYHD